MPIGETLPTPTHPSEILANPHEIDPRVIAENFVRNIGTLSTLLVVNLGGENIQVENADDTTARQSAENARFQNVLDMLRAFEVPLRKMLAYVDINDARIVAHQLQYHISSLTDFMATFPRELPPHIDQSHKEIFAQIKAMFPVLTDLLKQAKERQLLR